MLEVFGSWRFSVNHHPKNISTSKRLYKAFCKSVTGLLLQEIDLYLCSSIVLTPKAVLLGQVYNLYLFASIKCLFLTILINHYINWPTWLKSFQIHTSLFGIGGIIAAILPMIPKSAAIGAKCAVCVPCYCAEILTLKITQTFHAKRRSSFNGMPYVCLLPKRSEWVALCVAQGIV